MTRLLQGYPVWYGYKFLRDGLEDAHAVAADFVEISLDYPWPDYFRREDVAALKRAERDYGMRIAFHGPWAGKLISHPRSEIAQASLRVHEKCLRFASRFDPLYYNYHQNTDAATMRFREIRNQIDVIAARANKTLLQKANKYGIQLTIENNPTLFYGSMPDISRALTLPGLRFCFDTAHCVEAAHEGGLKKGSISPTDLVREPEKWLQRFGSKILAVHLQDCRVEGTNYPTPHLMLGDGNLDLGKLIRGMRETITRYVLLEIYYKKRRVSVDLRGMKISFNRFRDLVKQAGWAA